MGLLRFLLAIAVIGDHAAPPCGFLHLVGGTAAVEIFFVVSGFYMQMVLSGKYSSPGSFYLSRSLRIFPAYWIVAAITFSAWPVNGFSHIGTLGWQPAALVFFANFAILLQDALLFLGSDGGRLFFTTDFASTTPQLSAYLIVRPSWTLALELYFYFLSPYICRLSGTAIFALGLGLTATRLATYKLGLVGDPWYYRFFPFELPLFLLGMILYRAYADGILARKGGGGWAIAILVAIMMGGRIWFMLVPAQYTFVFVMLAAPTIPLLFSAFKNSQADRFVGDLSFPIYLVHFPIIQWVTPHYAIVVALSIAAAVLISIAIDRPIDRLRHRLLANR